MSNAPEPLQALVPRAVAQRLTRRGFLGGLAAAASSPLLAACGGGSSSSSGGGSSSSGGSGSLESALSVYTWGAYDDPKTFSSFTSKLGPKITVSSYDSNQEMIAKLVAAKGTSGYDIVVPTGPYVPQMIANKLLAELDHDKLPNISKVAQQYLGQSWDPKNVYSVCKDWGTTGFVYDTTKIKRELATWADFLDAAQNEASGQTSVLDVAEDVTGIYFWSNGIDWNTTDKAQLDACQDFLESKLAKHIKKFDSYPGSGGAMPKGSYTLMQAWNGDARQGLLAAKDPSQYKWVLPTPATELWMDNWCIVAGAKHPDAAHAFINYVLQPQNSVREIKFIGYNTGVTATEQAVKAAKAKYLDMVYFSGAQVATMKTGELNSATQRQLDILNSVKAAAAS